MAKDGATTEEDRAYHQVIRSGFNKDVALRNARREVIAPPPAVEDAGHGIARRLINLALRAARAVYRRVAPSLAPFARRLVFVLTSDVHRELSAQLRESASQVDELRSRVNELRSTLSDVDSVVRRTPLRIDDETLLIRAGAGLVVCPMSELRAIATLVETGDLEFGTRRVLERLLAPGAVYLDIGADLGLHTIAAGRRVGSSGKVISIESDANNARCLRRSVAVNGIESHVEVLEPRNLSNPAEEAIATLLGDRRPDVIRIGPGVLHPAALAQFHSCDDNPNLAIIASAYPIDPQEGSSPSDWIDALTGIGWRWCAIDEQDGALHQVSMSKLQTSSATNVLLARPQSTAWQRLAADV